MSSVVVPPPPSIAKGSCNCGAITLTVPSDAFPSHSIICHCIGCRASGGSLWVTCFRRIRTLANTISHRFSIDITIAPEKVTISSGQTKVYQTKGSSGKFVKRHFCGDCGSCVYSSESMLYSGCRLTVIHFHRPIFSDLENNPGVLFVKGGVFCASGFGVPPPRVQMFWNNHEEWETSMEGIAIQE